MKRLVTWVAGAAGGLAAYRALARRHEPVPEEAPDTRADELREKLAHARDAEQPPEPDSDTRRRAVHERGRAAVDEMRSGEGS